MSTTIHSLLVGVGSMLGDDQVGWLVAERVARQLTAQSEDPGSLKHGAPFVLKSSSGDIGVRLATIPLDVLDWMDGVRRLHVVDACRSCHSAGEVHRFDWSFLSTIAQTDSPDSALQIGGHTTHDYGIVDVLRLAEQTGRLPPEVVVWAVDGKRFELGDKMTCQVEQVVPIVSDRILTEVSAAANANAAAAD
jgi:hydrogenase maturation protease